MKAINELYQSREFGQASTGSIVHKLIDQGRFCIYALEHLSMSAKLSSYGKTERSYAIRAYEQTANGIEEIHVSHYNSKKEMLSALKTLSI